MGARDIQPCVYILASRRHGTLEAAIVREKRLKNWKRDWKIALIEEQNPDWHDLGPGFGFKAIAVAKCPYKTLRHPDESQDP